MADSLLLDVLPSSTGIRSRWVPWVQYSSSQIFHSFLVTCLCFNCPLPLVVVFRFYMAPIRACFVLVAFQIPSSIAASRRTKLVPPEGIIGSVYK